MKQHVIKQTSGFKKQRGISMVEVLITMVVMAIGLLGLAAMQYTSLKNGNGSQRRYLAALYTQDLTERMRANMTEVRTGSTYKDINNAASCGGACNGVKAVAADDLNVWKVALKRDLLEGVGKIAYTANIADPTHAVYDFTVTWTEDDPSDEAGDGPSIKTIQRTYKVKTYF